MVAPLDGIRVIDWTHVLAGPACAYYLGLLGAEVIKVERPGRGDAMRHRGGTDKARAAEGMSTAYMTQGAGKQSLALDLSREAGRDVFHRLLKTADVLVENHRPDTLARLGLTEDATRAVNPRLIHCAMTGYGRGNDMAGAPAYDLNIQAISGLMALTGTEETGPLRTGAPIVDYATGLAAALATTSALLQREKTGAGSFVDVSMLETAFSLMSSTITDYHLTGNAPGPRGNAANSRSPSSGVFACAEGKISLGVNEEAQFRALASALNRPNWLTDPRFADPVTRDVHKADLGKAISDILCTRSAHEWERILMAAGVPCARLRSLPEALDLPPATQRDFARRGAAGFCGLPFSMAHAPDLADRLSPQRLGSGTHEILHGLGYDEAEIETFAEQGVIGLT
ncbi:CaiB/BaiF CoA-transferase family protein [uncultured Roseobacter sp.]|uniref:CaiB/BaiF CoA transferase family protein n=1 Tax=uncultured Roseobacter sp. TaxID=114847 RepID=UPI002635B409|nr:CoA transferase [uncultured Roseobacter sp.]